MAALALSCPPEPCTVKRRRPTKALLLLSRLFRGLNPTVHCSKVLEMYVFVLFKVLFGSRNCPKYTKVYKKAKPKVAKTRTIQMLTGLKSTHKEVSDKTSSKVGSETFLKCFEIIISLKVPKLSDNVLERRLMKSFSLIFQPSF